MVTIKLTKDQIESLQSYSTVIKELSGYGNELTVNQQQKIFERADQFEDFFRQHNHSERTIRKS